MLGREYSTMIFGWEHIPGVKTHAQIGGMRIHFDHGHHHLNRHVLAAVFIGAHIAAAIPGMAKMLAHFGLPVKLAGWN